VELATLRTPRVVAAGADNRRQEAPGHWRYESAQWLAAQVHTDLVKLPGAHLGHVSEPTAFADALRPNLRTLL